MIKITNKLLKLFKHKLVYDSENNFTMIDALARCQRHRFDIQTVFDIGASDGKWTLMAMKYFPKAKFLLFEPLYERQDALKELKSKYHNIDYVQSAAGSELGETFFTVTDDLDGSSINDSQDENSRSIPVTTIDTQVREKNIKGPFLIKLDTHGFELPILNGAEETLKQTNLIIVEVYNFKLTSNSLRFHEMCSYMESIGFRCYDMVDPMLRIHDKALWQMDLFFIPDNHPLFSHQKYQ